ncbi:MAG: hypothetical protein NTW05_25530 [Pseudonocardiales bacterium]|nr:hypothetical protein [Pseudonocardiales bacterium]
MLLAQETRAAGGAALDQILIATAGAGVLTALLLVLGWGHRTGRITLLARGAAMAERSPLTRGLPGWVGLPTIVAMVALITALLGMYWDISLHITNGRDEGPLANIAHYPILFGLFGLFAAGVLAMVLPAPGERPGPAAVRITRDWHAPVGGVLLAAAGFYALLGFPLDDVWHRVFGQDVTLWGPTHLMLIGGAGLSLVALAVLDREGRLARAARPGQTPLARYLTLGMMMGGFLIGLSVFQAEWDFGVPQFRMVHQPYLIAVAAACALVTARLVVGRGGALFAVGFCLLVRGGVSVVVGPVLGELFAAVPLYLAEAVLVELAAVALRRRRLAFGAVAGLLIGTAGFAAEYAWTQVAFPLPWAPDMVAEGVLHAVLGGVAGGVLGALLVLGLEGRPPRAAKALFAACLVLIAVCVGNALAYTVPQGASADVALGEVRDGLADGVSVRFSPADLVDDPTWVTVTAWQGGDLVVEPLRPTGDGTWATDAAVPVDGTWKTLVRLHDGRALGGVEIFLPADEVLGEPEVPALAATTRPVIAEQQILQRELQDGVPAGLFTTGSLVVLALSLALVVGLAAGVARVARVTPEPVGPREQVPA